MTAPGHPVQIFMCGRKPRRDPCSVCKKRKATKLCDFPLRGAAEGKTCDRALCDSCAVKQGDVTRLPDAAVRLATKTRAETRKRGYPVAVLGDDFAETDEDTVDYCPAHAKVAP